MNKKIRELTELFRWYKPSKTRIYEYKQEKYEARLLFDMSQYSPFDYFVILLYYIV